MTGIEKLERYERLVAKTGDIYVLCPACSSQKISVKANRLGDSVFRCVECSAQFGRVKTWADYISFKVGGGLGSGEAARYFDYISHERGGDRFHGWTDARGVIVQTG